MFGSTEEGIMTQLQQFSTPRHFCFTYTPSQYAIVWMHHALLNELTVDGLLWGFLFLFFLLGTYKECSTNSFIHMTFLCFLWVDIWLGISLRQAKSNSYFARYCRLCANMTSTILLSIFTCPGLSLCDSSHQLIESISPLIALTSLVPCFEV